MRLCFQTSARGCRPFTPRPFVRFSGGAPPHPADNKCSRAGSRLSSRRGTGIRPWPPTPFPLAWLALVAAGIWLGGCAVKSREAVFQGVNAAVHQRTGQSVEWRQVPAGQQEASDATRELIEQPLTLDAAVRVALLQNRNLQAAFEELGIARADLMQASLVKNPEFDGSLRTPTDPHIRNDPVSPRTSTLDLDLAEDMLSLLLRGLRKKAAEAQLAKAQSQAVQAVLDLTADVKSRFVELQGARQRLELRRGVVAAAEASLDVARRLHAAGNVTDLELTNEQVLRDEAAVELAQEEADLVQAREKLAMLLGLGGLGARLAVEEPLPEIPAEEAPADSLEPLAVAQHPALAAARLEVQRLTHLEGLASATRWTPELKIGAHVERETEGDWTFGPSLTLAVPLFDQGQAQVARARAEVRQAEQRAAALEAEVRSSVRSAQSRVAAARARAESLRKVVLPLREKIVEQLQLEYNAMQASVFQLLQARQAVIDASRNAIGAVQDYWLARVELERAVGGKLP
jgi:outer membrane protein, heavy metal efflux system